MGFCLSSGDDQYINMKLIEVLHPLYFGYCLVQKAMIMLGVFVCLYVLAFLSLVLVGSSC